MNFGKSGGPTQPNSLFSPPFSGPWELFRPVQMLKREWSAESNGKLLHLFIPSKTATLVHEFVVEDLPLGRNAALAPEFAVKHVPWKNTLIMMMTTPRYLNFYKFSIIFRFYISFGWLEEKFCELPIIYFYFPTTIYGICFPK